MFAVTTQEEEEEEEEGGSVNLSFLTIMSPVSVSVSVSVSICTINGVMFGQGK